MRFVAFPATEYDEVLLGYQPGQMVEQWKNQHFEDHLCPCPQVGIFTVQPFDPADSLRELHQPVNCPSKSCPVDLVMGVNDVSEG
jgi:hypothetical protein